MRILLISYFFPPFNSVGAVRPGKLARYLDQRGHDVHVLTCKDQPFAQGWPFEMPEAKVTATGAWAINAPVELLLGGRERVAREGFATGVKIGSLTHWLGQAYKLLFHWPDGQLGWVNSAVRAGRALLAQQSYDLIYVSAPPFSALRIASKLSALSGVPWVAEFRDLWTDNHGYQYPAWRRKIERSWEARLLASASAVVTVSPPLLDQLKRFNLPAWEIRNGYDPDDFSNLPEVSGFLDQSSGLNITFTGNLYPAHYDLAAFCEGLARYRARGGRARVHVAGRNVSALLEQARRAGVEDMFSCKHVVTRPVALAMQKASDLLLTFLWNGGRQDGIYSTKLFEYAGAGRPILAVGFPDSDIGILLKGAGIGVACESAEMVAENLLIWQGVKQKSGQLCATPAAGFDFTREAQFAKLESFMTRLVASSAYA